MWKGPKKLFGYFAIFSLLLGIAVVSLYWLPLIRESNTYNVINTQKHRKAVLNSVCLKNNLTRPLKELDKLAVKQLFVEENHKFIYCEVPKAGCSNWKRIIFMLKTNGKVQADYLEHNAIHDSSLLKRLSDYPLNQQHKILEDYTKVIFTREPLQRLVSAYRDKVVHPTGYYASYLPKAIKAKYRKNKNSTDNVRFDEFVRYVIQNNPKTSDVHWRPVYHLCDPCNIDYDIVGKFETLKQDSDYVLKVIGAPAGIQYPEIKQFNESRTDTKTTKEYFQKLPLHLIQTFIQIYRLDFDLFDYV
uniref:Carbohydrate sulfotransferase n=1 Tax=Leptobrachium leishanense TaxID=445787 RepID=A0A8C5QE01_9ANUR